MTKIESGLTRCYAPQAGAHNGEGESIALPLAVQTCANCV
jgi:hypothetical protein